MIDSPGWAGFCVVTGVKSEACKEAAYPFASEKKPPQEGKPGSPDMFALLIGLVTDSPLPANELIPPVPTAALRSDGT
jgi:hypothetical protein